VLPGQAQGEGQALIQVVGWMRVRGGAALHAPRAPAVWRQGVGLNILGPGCLSLGPSRAEWGRLGPSGTESECSEELEQEAELHFWPGFVTYQPVPMCTSSTLCSTHRASETALFSHQLKKGCVGRRQ
jgi:hypothetical protein